MLVCTVGNFLEAAAYGSVVTVVVLAVLGLVYYFKWGKR